MPKCSLCLSEVKSLVKSHIYPRALNQREGQPASTLAVVGRNTRPQKSPTGIYERFLCQNCENIFNPCDTHFVNLVRDVEIWERRLDPRIEDPLAWVIPEGVVSPRLLRLFANSLLLRAHLVSHPFFRKVQLGPHYERLRTLVLTGDPGGDDEFAVLLIRQKGIIGQIGSEPTKLKLDGVRAYWLAPPGLRVVVKADKRPFPALFREHQIRDGHPVVAIRRPQLQEEVDDIKLITHPFRDNISRILRTIP
ncbi:hypothetical protein [Stenotrophomonas terrae]|uniref:hypothetical protein n=1 Tax=Stenotrophomonas terrae TaxID=405446 RepID=UPI000AFBBD48|nr:hypothetical protein [Stenotrophomonas terrae]